MTIDGVSVVQPAAHECPHRCEPILRSVPDWFGIEEATLTYIAATLKLPTWIARVGERDAGFVTIEKHFPHAADVHCIAVHHDFHGQGVGTALLRHVEPILQREGVRFLQVKTMGPSKPNREYAMTLRFYLRVGFTPLEEIHGLWPGIPCLILVKAIGGG